MKRSIGIAALAAGSAACGAAESGRFERGDRRVDARFCRNSDVRFSHMG
ncbi:hypothetical protein [Variovorax sp. WS11]|nr:hypothetical protein [Variovorax sp. WS11]NDZ19049.1 hypothetical protein [Variovorax sp. WS11]